MEQTDFEIKLTDTIKRKVDYSRFLRPEDFLKSRDVKSLRFDIEHKLKYRDELTEDRHYIPVDQYNYDLFDIIKTDLKIPPKFIERWKELLGMEPYQVINPKYIPELKEHAHETEMIGGNALNHHLNDMRYSEYSLPSVYHEVHFDDDKKYTCYVRYDDHDWSAPVQTNILYIEGF